VVDAAETLLRAEGVSRSFGVTRALDGASLLVERGEIHSLAGENGSGKSTLIKILSGVIGPDAGELLWHGRPVRFRRPAAAQRAGIATVFQETLVVLEQTVLENVFIGTDGVFRRGRRGREEEALARQTLDQLGLDIALDRPAWSLSLAERQIVTIARALVRPWDVLLLDEASSALDADQRDRLFAFLRAKRDDGKAILFTSHRMDELRQLADTVSVLRLGRTVARLPVAEAPVELILGHMAGRAEEEREATRPGVARRARTAAEAPATVLRGQDLVLRPGRRPFSLDVALGEIVGVAGLEGHGQVELALALAGLARPAAGSVEAVDRQGAIHPIRRGRDAARQGIAYVPRDRKQEGLFFSLSIQDNFSMALLRSEQTAGLLRRRALRARYRDETARVRLKAGWSGNPIGTLSGGNQQKILLSRWLATDPSILVLNDPLRGVDANTKDELYELLRGLSEQGLTIVLVSTEIVELLALSDRIAVLHDAELQALLPAAETDETAIVAAMFGHREEAVDA
jgi:ABC-type sugar transport system ATPase subunit